MPPEPDKQWPDVETFIGCVMDAVGVTSAGQLTTLLVREGLLEATALRKVGKWKSGAHGPRFQDTMLLLRRAGFLTPAALQCLER